MEYVVLLFVGGDEDILKVHNRDFSFQRSNYNIHCALESSWCVLQSEKKFRWICTVHIVRVRQFCRLCDRRFKFSRSLCFRRWLRILLHPRASRCIHPCWVWSNNSKLSSDSNGNRRRKILTVLPSLAGTQFAKPIFIVPVLRISSTPIFRYRLSPISLC